MKKKKSNQFVDKRFGENDPNLDFEEKMFLRFQKEKVIKTRKRGFGNLDNDVGEETVLTHKGEILGSNNASGFVGEEDDASFEGDSDLDQQDIPSTYPRENIQAPSSSMSQLEGRNSSGMTKFERAERKLAYEQQRHSVDEGFKALVSAQMLEVTIPVFLQSLTPPP